jgi:HD superfamily phosphohydrolase
MEVATKMHRAIAAKRPGVFGEGEEAARHEQLLRLAALLHDVGHAPFSHASEELFPNDEDGNPLKHEDYTAALILNSELAHIIQENFASLGITAQDVVNVFSDPTSLGRAGVLLQDIVSGELDADRMDYLARDSLYAGVTYGRYDLDRLLDTVVAVEDAEGAYHLAVEEDGRFALEAFLLARYYMFLQLYLHKHRRFYDLALTKVIRRLLGAEDGRYPGPADWQQFLELDDVWIDSSLPAACQAGDTWASCLFDRKPWKVVAEHVVGTMDGPRPNMDPADWTSVIAEIRDQFPDAVEYDDAKAKNFQRTDPAPYISGAAEEGERPKILVEGNDGAAHRVEVVSGLVRQMSQERIRIRRLYARPEAATEVSSRLRSLGVSH